MKHKVFTLLLSVIMLTLGANITRADDIEDMLNAVIENDVETVAELLQSKKIQESIKTTDPNENSIFAYLCQEYSKGENVSLDILRMFIKAGANLNATNKGYTPLVIAEVFLDERDTRPLIKLLIESGADVNNSGTKGFTPLALAAGNDNSPDVVKMLIEAGADVNLIDTSTWANYTPLMVAIVSKNAAVENVRTLIAAGADVNAKDAKGRTVLKILKKRDMDKQTKNQLMEILKAAGAK